MWSEILAIGEPVALLFGVTLVLIGCFIYSRRKADYLAPIKIFFNQVNDLAIAEFKFIRSGVLLLILAIILRFINLTFFPT